jgi:hypothetical protein
VLEGVLTCAARVLQYKDRNAAGTQSAAANRHTNHARTHTPQNTRSVEKPFLKPVIIAGPHTGERSALMHRLAEEFPDVFAFPRAHTTHDPEWERRAHVAADGGSGFLRCLISRERERVHQCPFDNPPFFTNRTQPIRHQPGDELGLPDGATSIRYRSPRHPDSRDGSSSGGGGGGHGDMSGASDQQEELPATNLAPPPVVLDREEFDAYVSGGKFLEWHPDLFCHPLATHRTGHTPEDVRAVIKAGASRFVKRQLSTSYNQSTVVRMQLDQPLSTDQPPPPPQASSPSWSWRRRASRPSRPGAWTASPYS